MLYFFIGEIKIMTVHAFNVIKKIKGDDEGKRLTQSLAHKYVINVGIL